jgi:hypothetical protein
VKLYFCDKIEDHALSVILLEPTHFQRDSATLIDLCLTSFPENIGMFSQISLPEIKTGHDLIYGFMHVCDFADDNQDTLPVSYYRVYIALDLTKTRRSLEARDFSPILRMADPNDQLQYFNSIIVSVFQENVPLKQYPPKNSDNPWMNFEISRLIVERDIAYNIWTKIRSTIAEIVSSSSVKR